MIRNCHVLSAGTHFFTPDNCLLDMDATQKLAIYLQFTALVLYLMEWKTYSLFSQKQSNQFENCLPIMIKVFEFYESVRHERRSLHNFVFIFHVDNVTWNNRKKNVEYL